MDVKELLRHMTSADEETRDDARYELSMLMDDAIARAFLDIAAGDAGEEVRADAIVGLGPIIEECSIDYSDDEDFDLGPEMGPPVSRGMFRTIVSELRDIYDGEGQPKLVCRRAFEVLIRDPQPWHSAEVKKHFASTDAEWKRTAVFAMGMIPGFDREIATILDEAEGDLLYEAVRAAGSMEVSGAAERIREIALDEDADVGLRVAAILALPNVDHGSFDVLDELRSSVNSDVAEAAEEALEELSFAERVGGLDDDDEE